MLMVYLLIKQATIHYVTGKQFEKQNRKMHKFVGELTPGRWRSRKTQWPK